MKDLVFTAYEMGRIDELVDINKNAGLDQAKFILEESGEFAQAYSKLDRQKATVGDCINEAYDVLTAVLVYLRRCGISSTQINDAVMSKIYRAIDRNEHDGEV